MSVGKRELLRLKEASSDRDIEVLVSLLVCRFLTTGQIARLHFADKQSTTASLRATNRTLVKLRDSFLITALERRIGGVRAGSASYVWALTGAGARLLDLLEDETESTSRHRVAEPSLTFLRHTLFVSEIHVRLSEALDKGIICALDVQHEPDCWRQYVASHGARGLLKPDLAVTTMTEDYEDHWFIEADLASEPLARIVRTSKRYEDYKRDGSEQRRNGVFPAVVWVVPTVARKDAIMARLGEERGLCAQMFKVIELDDLKALLINGAGV
jgi:hypothetical protein